MNIKINCLEKVNINPVGVCDEVKSRWEFENKGREKLN